MGLIDGLTLWQKIQLFISGYAFSHYEFREETECQVPIYIGKCKKHGLYTDYPHGFSPEIRCDMCQEAEG